MCVQLYVHQSYFQPQNVRNSEFQFLEKEIFILWNKSYSSFVHIKILFFGECCKRYCMYIWGYFCAVGQSRLTLQFHRLQHARPLCPSPSPKVCRSQCPSHWWCHPAISSSDALFSFCPQSFPASGTFPVS